MRSTWARVERTKVALLVCARRNSRQLSTATMAFAPRGSRPKATLDGTDQTQSESGLAGAVLKRLTRQSIGKERMPLLVMGASEPSRTRERVSRKPPLPRLHQASRVAPAVATREKDAKAKVCTMISRSLSLTSSSQYPSKHVRFQSQALMPSNEVHQRRQSQSFHHV